ncbi:MAG: hypothetical protein M1298_05720, partial [Chloroflexi bacterium]|nr:hypothetical protein [Chloroflexota bacterium]
MGKIPTSLVLESAPVVFTPSPVSVPEPETPGAAQSTGVCWHNVTGFMDWRLGAVGSATSTELARVLTILRDTYGLTNEEITLILSQTLTAACQNTFQPPSPIRVTIDPTTGQPLLLTPQSTDQRDDCDASMLQWQETPLPPAWRTFIHHTAQQLLHEQHAELEMMRALRQLAEKYELPRETVLSAVEEALTEAYRREFAPPGIITVRIDPITGKQQLYTVKTAVRRVYDPHREIALSEAQHLQPNAIEHEAIFIETDLPESWGRVAAMAFRHLVQQKMHSAKQRYAFERFSEQEGELVSGFITRIDSASG